MFKTIVLGQDGSELARKAIPFAVELARRDDAKLVIVHIVERLAAKGSGYPAKANDDKIRAQLAKQAEDHAFRKLIEHERFDRVVAAGATNGDGFSADDVAWLLRHAPGEVVIFRPARIRPKIG